MCNKSAVPREDREHVYARISVAAIEREPFWGYTSDLLKGLFSVGPACQIGDHMYFLFGQPYGARVRFKDEAAGLKFKFSFTLYVKYDKSDSSGRSRNASYDRKLAEFTSNEVWLTNAVTSDYLAENGRQGKSIPCFHKMRLTNDHGIEHEAAYQAVKAWMMQ